MYMIALQTTRVNLIPLTEADKTLFIELYTSDKLMRKIADTFSVPDAIKLFEKTLLLTQQPKPTVMRWVIKHKESGESLGIVGFSGITYPDQADLGIILRREAHGKGIVVDIGNVLCDYVLTQVAISRVRAEFHHENLITQKITRKMGFGEVTPHPCKKDYLECYLTDPKLG